MFEFLALAALVVGIPVLTLLLVVRLDVRDDYPETVVGPSGHPGLDRLLVRLRLWHAAVSFALTGLIVAALFSHRHGEWVFPMLLTMVLVLVLFLRAWRYEFVTLMRMGDDEFPGRNDKIAWVILMLALPPVGVWMFRSYRSAHRLEVEAAAHGARPRPKPAPVDDL